MCMAVNTSVTLTGICRNGIITSISEQRGTNNKQRISSWFCSVPEEIGLWDLFFMIFLLSYKNRVRKKPNVPQNERNWLDKRSSWER